MENKYKNFNEYAATNADYLMYVLSGKFPVMKIEFLDVSKFEVDPNEIKEWYLNGKHHRVDGPAIEYADGTKFWYLNGKRHREDGPAVEDADGTKMWWLNGKQVQEF